MIESGRLRTLINLEQMEPEPFEARLPEPSEVLYAEPNPDNSRKACGNCLMWSQEKACFLHSPDLAVEGDMICGHYVFGTPAMAHDPQQLPRFPLSPESTGLERAPGGASCDLCAHYERDNSIEGTCRAVIGADGESTVVSALGGCTRWVRR